MRNQAKILALALVAVGFLPALAFAKDNQQNENGKDHGFSLGVMANHNPLLAPMQKIKDSDNDGGNKQRNDVNGTVSATSTTGFSLTDSQGTVWTINTSGAAIISAFGQTIALADVALNSHANVKGTANGNVVTASKIIVSPANTHTAFSKGTVTAVANSSFTLQLNNHGIISSATVNTNASTTVIQNGATTTTSVIAVGSKVAVKGLWDQILNVLNAIKIKIF